ncbi:MAG: hypothetical protein PHT69_08360 [Bacteroidales bacterium]|nr:hypothetical protein [Bacteroidales bacterium]
MKSPFRYIYLVLSGLFIVLSAAAQVPQFINFQGIATDANGQTLANTNIQIRLTVSDSALAGQVVYQELRAVQTNPQGSFSFQIGKDPAFTTAGVFKNINWLSGQMYLKVDYDPTNTMSFNLGLDLIKIVSMPYTLAADQVVYIDTTGVQNGETLIYNASTNKFEPGTVATGVLSAGSGISISSNTISNTGDLSTTNEIQQLNKGNDTIYLSQNGSFAVIPPQGTVSILPPEIELLIPYGISGDSAVLRGHVNPHGLGASVVFEWGTDTTFSNAAPALQSPVYGTADTTVTLTLNGLQNVTTYYYRMKAINAAGDTTSGSSTFMSGTNLPVVHTMQAFNYSGNSATVQVWVSQNGGLPITARGVCWSTSPLPVATGNHTTEAGDTGTFNSILTGLDTCTLYYARAYATNALGTAYGAQISFNSGYTIGFLFAGGHVFYNDGTGHGLVASPIPAPGTSSFGCQGQLIGTSTAMYSGENNTALIVANCSTNTCARIASNFSYGGFDDWYLPSKDEISLVYGVLQAPNLVNYPETNYASSSESDSNNFWYQNFSYGPLLPYFKDWTYYSILPIRSFSTACVPVYLPEVSTVQVYQVSSFAAKCTGKVLNNGGAYVTAKGLCWSTTPNPTLSNSFSSNGTSNDAFTHHITGLQPGTTYYVRAYATNSSGTAYGNSLSFTTFTAANRILTLATSDITGARCTTGGFIADDMGDSITARGICYKTTHDPNLSNLLIFSGSDTGSFVIQMRDLHPHTTYYVKAFGISAGDTIYGNEISFKTTGQMIIGDHYQGGIVYYVDQTGEHGLVAAETDQALSLVWGCFGQFFGATGQGIFAGQANTTAIVNGCPTPGIPARVCDTLVLNGYSDWYMPSKEELYYMYANLHLTGLSTFTNGWYGSSSEFNGNAFSGYEITNGNAYGVLSKLTTPVHVRAINKF